MDQARLQGLLEELHRELLKLQSVDPKNRELLRTVLGDIGSALGSRASVPAERYQGLRGRLGDTAAALAASHPKLAETIEQVIDTLAFYNL